MGNWMPTFTGKKFYPLEPRIEDIDIADIAHALSNLCRFGGHCREFYSISEHCVHVSHMVDKAHALEGLLHDATEAFLVDMPSPIKRELKDYQRAERRLYDVIAEKFSIPKEMSKEVHQADKEILHIEALVLFENPEWARRAFNRDHIVIHCWEPWEAKYRFTTRYRQLTKDML